MDFVFHADRLWYVAPALFIFCLALDRFIWRMNRRWIKNNPDQPRHSYAPLFTAIGNLGLIIGLGILTAWQYAAVMLALNIACGILMWRLHDRRWQFRLPHQNQHNQDNAL